MDIQELKIEYEPTDTLLSYANNAKIHTSEQIEQIVRSIGDFGFNDPVAVWTNRDGKSEIIEGHGRIMAAKKLGIEEVPVIHLDRLTDEQRRAYGLVHNKLTMNTGWDFAKLDEELEDLRAIEMAAFGFENFDYDPESLFDNPEPVEHGEPQQQQPSKTVVCPECGHEFQPE